MNLYRLLRGDWRLGSAGADTSRLCLQCPRQNLRDILDAEVILRPHGFDTILKHGDAERTSCCQCLGASIKRFLYPGVVDALADLFLHPNPAAAATATERTIAVPAHLLHT